MKSKPEKHDEYGNFSRALDAVLKVSHADMQQHLAEEKSKKKPSTKRASSGRVSSEKD